MPPDRETSRPSAFPATQWSVVLDVAATEPGRAASALEKLCIRYWYPIYAFVRQREVHDLGEVQLAPSPPAPLSSDGRGWPPAG